VEDCPFFVVVSVPSTASASLPPGLLLALFGVAAIVCMSSNLTLASVAEDSEDFESGEGGGGFTSVVLAAGGVELEPEVAEIGVLAEATTLVMSGECET